MGSRVQLRTAALLLLGSLAIVAIVGGSTSAAAAPQAISLCAVPGTTTVTGSVTVPIWGFAIPPTAGDCSNATASLPGPVLDVNVGDVVTIALDNQLPAGHELAFEIPGITLDPGPTDGSEPIVFTASAPGTYIYESGGDAGRQEAMGLYGALVVRPAAAGQAYDDPTTAFDVESTLVLSQVDPAFNASPDAFDMRDYLATYWLINGKAYPDTAPIEATAGQKVLLRFVNGGYDNTSMELLGTHMRMLARGATPLSNPFDAAAETIPAGGTEDALATMPSYAAPSDNGFPLFNRNLHLVNGSDPSPGGMLTFVRPPQP